MGQTIFKVIPLSSLVSLKHVKAPRAAALRSVRGLAGFCTGFVKYVSHFENSSICFHGFSDFKVNFPCASVTHFDLGTNSGICSWVLVLLVLLIGINGLSWSDLVVVRQQCQRQCYFLFVGHVNSSHCAVQLSWWSLKLKRLAFLRTTETRYSCFPRNFNEYKNRAAIL